MATLFIDLENGNDNHGGTSFSPLASGTDGRITSTTFSSATASFPNDGSLIGQYLSIFNGTIYAVYNITAWVSSTSLTIAALSGGTSLANQAVDRQFFIGGRWRNITTGATAVRTIPGDTIRMMGSPAPTSLGQNGVWTSQALQATRTLVSSTNTTPISITSNSHGYITGDTVVVTGHSVNTNANGTWEITRIDNNTFTLNGSVGNGTGLTTGSVRLRSNSRVMLTSAVTQNIASTGPGRAAWVASANCSHLFNTSFFKEHANADVITVNTAFTTGKAAYYTLPATLNLSSYQQVSFWIYVTGDDVLATEAELRLCSDAVGDTVVDTVPIPFTPGSRVRAVTWDKGAALGSSIASISLFINTDLSTTGNVGVTFSNIIACKASSEPDSLTLTSLIGKNTTGETFWGIQSINGTRVMLDADTNAAPTSASVRGYYGTSGTVTTWKRETIKLGPGGSATTALQTIAESGTDGNSITYSGGWDRTNMSTQNLETWLDGQNGNGVCFFNDRSFTSLLNCSVVRVNNAVNFNTNAAFNNFTFGSVNNLASSVAASSTFYWHSTITIGFICASAGGPYVVAGTASFSNLNIIYGILSNAGNAINIGNGAILSVTGSTLNTLIANNGGGVILGAQAGYCTLKSLTFENNASASITQDQGATPFRYLIDCLLNDGTEVTQSTNWNLSQLASQNHDQTANNYRIFMDGGLISSATDQRNTPSGISWKLQPTSTTLRASGRPVTLSLAKVACAANSLVTVKAWMRRDNSGLTMRLVCKGGQIAGVANDVVSALSTTNAWEEETITFTPTEVGVVEITAEAWGGTTFSGWVDDMTISQA